MSLTVNLSETCSEAQVDLFLALFRGHPDRMARRLEGTRYELHDHALDAAAARAHLNGLNHAALIPRLPDGTTRVLAIGLHNRKGRTWKSDALLLARAAAARGIPLYLERTRSALGVHAWVFFRDAISVEAAHQLAELLLRDAASEDGWVKSFERIVPAADGEGPELVSLPLCGAAVREGNGVFIEAARGMPAVRDQWALLASLRRMDRVSVHRVLAGEPVPVAAPAPDQDTPTALGAMRAASLVLRRPLSRRLAAWLRRLLVFPNPEYARRKAADMSLRGVPRRLAAFERREDGWLLPAALVPRLAQWCAADVRDLHVLDARWEHRPAPRNLPHALDENQAAALQAVLAVEWGVLEAADGMRRSLVALAAAAERGVPTLVLVQSAARLQQWREDAVLMLGMEEADIGSAATLAARGHFLTVAPYAAIAGHAWPALELRFGFLILDEVRRVPLPVLREAVCALPARWLLALTDLPPRADGLDAMAALYVGPVAHRMGAREDMLLDVVLKTTSFHFETDAAAEPPPEDGPLFTLEPPGPTGPSRRRSAAPDRAREWNALLEALCQHEGRTRQIVRDVVAEARDGHACLVFTTRREHALLLAERIGEEVPVATLVGTMTPQQRREALRRFRDGEVLVLVAMEQLAAGGFEVPHLERVFLAFPLKEASLRQFMGRLTQPNPDRKTARLYDYLDENVGRLEFLARERRKYYKRVNTTQNPDTTQLRLPFDA